MEGISLYERFVKKSELYFSEEDFQVDVMAQISQLTEQNKQLKQELAQSQHNMKKQAQTIIHVAGNYIAQQNIDIHDNPHSTIFATAQPSQSETKTQPQHSEEADYAIPIPAQGRYTAVRRYIEERKLCDNAFKTYCDTHTRVELCRRLTDEFGWLVDEHALGRNINRNR